MYISIADLFSHNSLRKIYNHAISANHRLDKNLRIKRAEKQIFGINNEAKE
jgi:hypothetical protein